LPSGFELLGKNKKGRELVGSRGRYLETFCGF
jgi:hypothetical protein